MAGPKHSLHNASTAPWTVAITQLLSDGLWHDYKTIVSQAAPHVPPGPAWRYAEKRRLEEYTKRGTEPGPRKFGDKNSTIRSGQKYYVRNAIMKLRKRNVVEVKYDPNPALKYKKPISVRLTPQATIIVQTKPLTAAQKEKARRQTRELRAKSLGFTNYSEYRSYLEKKRKLKNKQEVVEPDPEVEAIKDRVMDYFEGKNETDEGR